MDSEWDWQSLFDKTCGKEIMRINVFCALWCCCHYPRPQFSKKNHTNLVLLNLLNNDAHNLQLPNQKETYFKQHSCFPLSLVWFFFGAGRGWGETKFPWSLKTKTTNNILLQARLVCLFFSLHNCSWSHCYSQSHSRMASIFVICKLC